MWLPSDHPNLPSGFGESRRPKMRRRYETSLPIRQLTLFDEVLGENESQKSSIVKRNPRPKDVSLPEVKRSPRPKEIRRVKVKI